MIFKNRRYLPSITWAISLITIGSVIGLATKNEIGGWYSTLTRSSLTPSNYIFSIVWPALYSLIGICGHRIYTSEPFKYLKSIKVLYVVQLVLNWMWSPLFFSHQVGLSLFVLCCMDIIVGVLIWLTYSRIKLVSYLLAPYFLWIIFATYLNAYIWLNN